MNSDSLPLSRAVADRAAHRRSEPDLLAAAWRTESTRVLVLHGSRLAVTGEALDLRRPAELEQAGIPAPVDTGHAAERASASPADRTSDAGVAAGALLWFFLGEHEGTTFLALVLPPGDPRPQDRLDMGVDARDSGSTVLAALVDGATWATLREVGHRLEDRDTGLAAAAVGLAAWHPRHVHCPRCGAPTVPALGGWVRRCTVDGSDHYPRTDPAVIMAVTDDQDRLLLGHAPHWPERRFSTLAGYVEPGESLEAAVRREVGEEVGVVVGEVAYQGSQPWPFPASLMLAFTARATSTEIDVDGDELTEARWFTRDELVGAVGRGEVLLPTRASVARALIEDWLGAPIESD